MHHFSGQIARWREAAVAALLVCALAGHSAQAQAPAPVPVAHPGNSAGAVPALVYRSALQSYRPWREQGPGDWRALNDEVARIGGWRAYLREAQQAPAETGPEAAKPGAAPHLSPAPTARPAGAAPAAPTTTPPTAQPPAIKATPHAHH